MCIRDRIYVERVVGAALHAGLAADAALAVEVHDSVPAPEEGRGRTDLDAGRILAMVAAGDLEGAARVGEHALLDVFHPCLLYTSDAADERSSVDLGGRR